MSRRLGALCGTLLAASACRTEIDHAGPFDCRGPWPDAGSTGWAHTGAALQPYPGPYRITTSGAVVDGADLSDCLEIAADHVTVRRSRVRTANLCGSALIAVSSPGGAASGVVLEDLELDGLSAASSRGVTGSGFAARRLDVHGVQFGFDLGGGTSVEESWIHDLAGEPAAAIACHGGSTIALRHNDLQNQNASDAAVFLAGDFAPIAGVLLRNNRLAGGGYTLYGGSDPRKPFPSASGVEVVGNCWSRAFFESGGFYGPVTGFDAGGPGNVWTDNRWQETGEAIPAP